MRTVLPFLLVLAPIAGKSSAQTTHGERVAVMARADSALGRGDRRLARVLYAEVLAADSSASRAVFRLAQLDDSDERALSLYRRYIALEPDDPWGHMAEGDLLARLGRLDEALVAYDGAHAIAPDERDVAVGRARLLVLAGQPDLAADVLTAWITSHPDDGEGWDLLGRARMRAGRPRSASSAFQRADAAGLLGAHDRLGAARAAAAPAIVPEASSSGDSDGNRTTRLGGSVDFMVTDGLRLGAGATQHSVRSDIDDARGFELDARVSATPSAPIRLNGSVGFIRYEGLSESAPAPGPGQGPPTVPQRQTGTWDAMRASARVRFRAPGNGPSLDLRLERAPIGYNPQLIENHVERSEARATIELPLAVLRLRGIGRFGRLTAAGEEANGRTSLEGAVIYPVGTRLQPSVQYRRTGFDRASTAGYFAPRLVETIETGAYVESGDDGVLTLSGDVGAGLQRVTTHGGSAGGWSRVWRGWAQASLAMGPGRSWYVDVEAYDAPFALDAATATGSWRFLSVATGLRFSLR